MESFVRNYYNGAIGLLFAAWFVLFSDAAEASGITISGAPKTDIYPGETYTFQPTVSSSNQSVSFTITNKPAWASFRSSTGKLWGTPQTSHAGTYSNIVITAKAGPKSAQLAAFSIKVIMPNRPPTISGTAPAKLTLGEKYWFRPTATDADGDTLTFSVVNRPAWAWFITTNGGIGGTPTTTGTYNNIVISVSDGRGSTATLPPFSITVAAGNQAPTISGAPATQVAAGATYWFKPAATDPDGNSLTFSVSNLPVWARFNASTGELSGTPSATQAGTYSGIVIAVTDGQGGSASLPAFAIQVSTSNRAPTIGGAPAAQVVSDSPYLFKPMANDPDGDTLTFSIANRPSWASFDPASGTLSGTPAAADVATYSNIVISVSDGKGGTAMLPAFDIAVTQSANGQAMLSWIAPTENTDGTALTNLAGYRIQYGTVQGGPYTTTVALDNPSISSYVIENLAPGTYYFVVTARNTTGQESQLSGEASKVIN